MLTKPHLVALTVSLMLTACLSAQAVTLRIANQGDATSLDPHSLQESLQLSVTGNIYEPLVTRGADFKLTAALATDWKQTAPTVWRFNLRKNVQFHDGTPFTADDVIFSYDRARARAPTSRSTSARLIGSTRSTTTLSTSSPSSRSQSCLTSSLTGT